MRKSLGGGHTPVVRQPKAADGQGTARGASSPVASTVPSSRVSPPVPHAHSSSPVSQASSPVPHVSSQLAMRARVEVAKVPISACGRTVSVEAAACRSLYEVQEALQEKLQMQGQMFEIFDVNGEVLNSDSKVREAVQANAVPLCATLTDASIHYIENRREELAQMQWKLVRDQMTGTNGKLAQLSRQVSDTSSQLEDLRTETQMLVERTRADIMTAIEDERETMNLEMRSISERITGLGQLLNAERTKREIDKQATEQQAESIRDLLDAERDARRRDFAAHEASFEEIRGSIELERSSAAALEDRFLASLHTLEERFEHERRERSDALQDHTQAWKTAQMDSMEEVRRAGADAVRLRDEHDKAVAEARAGLSAVGDRCTSLENRVSEASRRQAETLVRLIERTDRISQALDGMKLEDGRRDGGLQIALDKMRDLADAVTATEDEARSIVMREKAERDEHMCRTQQQIHLEQSRQLGELESKLGERLDSKTKTMNTMIGEVAKRLGQQPGESPMVTVTRQSSPMVTHVNPGSAAIPIRSVPTMPTPPPFAFASVPRSAVRTAQSPTRASSAAPLRSNTPTHLPQAPQSSIPTAPVMVTLAPPPPMVSGAGLARLGATSPTSVSRPTR